MDYIREINAFYDNDMINHLNQSAGHLYLVLLNIANRLFWKEGFMVSDALLMARAGIKDRRTFRRAMDELVKADLIKSTQTTQGTAYTIKGLCCRGTAKNAAKNVTPNAANDVSQETNPAKDAALIAENNAEFAKSAATDVTFNAPNDIDPATDAALNAGNNADFTKNPATDATFNARKNPVLAKNAASNVAFIAHYDRDKPSNDAGSGSAQTKLNKQNEKEKETKQTTAAVFDEGVNNKELIAELVAAYRETPGIENSKGDYPFIGALYNEYGYDQVLYGIHELSMAAATTRIEKPLIYLRAILIRAGPGRISYQKENNQIREEDPSAKYERERYRG